ncbi:hypothetical protein CROQUDRAFT_45936 [Cronartium quercuum f. sp. fusiforme G11]|uniref:Uncharacterized protein n=1 Tax=Cronartium quercuum f. sp. fusiforme G11 TaxID=708437 RepID=A0A9P6NGT8_9BASI|nr:hypothetical protein CROQUDRAFT_45936 [Cronartium quercuum f. sp. fusiforme G11]
MVFNLKSLVTSLRSIRDLYLSPSPPKYTPTMGSRPLLSHEVPPAFSQNPSSPPAYPIQSYAIHRHDATSAVLLEPAPAAPEPRFAVRIHSDSIYLFRPGKTDLFEKPVMEASIKGLIKRKEAKLDDWREKRRGRKGKYCLRHRHGMYVYTSSAEKDSKAWREDTRGCLHLTTDKSPTCASLACLHIPPVTPCGLDKLHNLTGQIDLLDESVTHGVEEELAILTCITTHVITRRTQV